MSLKKDLERLNEQQADIVKKFRRPSLVIAGPGTGKTRTVSVLIGKLLEEGIRLKEILALTFSDKAANELKTRVLEYFPKSFDECWISTFHSFCARILREQYFTVGVKPDFKLLTGFKEALMLSQICSELDPEAYPEYGQVLTKRGFQQEVLTFISLLKSNLISSDEFHALTSSEGFFDKRSQKRFKEVASLFKLYERERERTGYLDFRDLIALTIKALQNKSVARLYAERFRVIIVDEFQDTDPAQFHLLTLLSEASSDCRIAVIGDPRQSIYRFRGANPEMMTPEGPFKKRFRAKVFPLQINYRCAKEILETSSRLNWFNKNLGDDDNLIPASQENGFVTLYKARDEAGGSPTNYQKSSLSNHIWT